MQNAKNQNLLKLWLSFFCLSLANALASDSVGKIHAVHVNEVIRIKVIQTQRFSLWNICAGSRIDICQTNYHTRSSEREGPVRVSCDCQNTALVSNFTPAPAEHLFPHFPYWLPWRERFPRRPWFSKVFEDNRLLKSTIPSPTFTRGRHAYAPRTGAEPEEQHASGIATCAGREAGRSQRLYSPQLRLRPFVARARTSPQHSRYNLRDLLKILYFPATLTVLIIWKKKKKDEKFNTFISSIVRKWWSLLQEKQKEK